MYDKGCDELTDESGAIDICAHCAAEDKLQPGLYFCFQCGPFGRYICGDCNKQHKKFLNGHKIKDLSAAAKQPRGIPNMQEDEMKQAKQQLDCLVKEIETRQEVPDKVIPDGELARNIYEARKKLSKHRTSNSKLEDDMQQAKQQLESLLNEIESRKDVPDKVIPVGEFAKTVYEARKKLSIYRTSNSKLEDEMKQAKQLIERLVKEIETREVPVKVIPDGELARNIYEARKKLSKDGTSNSKQFVESGPVLRILEKMHFDVMNEQYKNANDLQVVGQKSQGVKDNVQKDTTDDTTSIVTDICGKVTQRYNEVNLVVAYMEMEKQLFNRLSNPRNYRDLSVIADLSDPYRPTKLAENYNELLDNQWTDAYDELEKSMKETDLIQLLVDIMSESYRECADISRQQLTIIKELTERTNLDEKSRAKGSADVRLSELQTKVVTKLRKESADIFVKSLQSYFKGKYGNDTMNKRNQWFDKRRIQSYTLKCIELCWLMHVQAPPVYMDIVVKPGDKFDSNKFKFYTKSGNKIDFLVWPPLLLHEGGPLLCKGVVQGK